MIHDDSDVLMAFAVAGFINADIYKAIQSLGALWFKIMKTSGDTVANSLPVDAHVA